MCIRDRVNAVVGIGANKEIARIVREALEGKRIETFPPKCELPLEGERVQSTPSYFSYLKIAEGCDNHCTYCAIPLIRGGYRSRKMEDILAEAEKLEMCIRDSIDNRSFLHRAGHALDEAVVQKNRKAQTEASVHDD